MTTFAKFRRLGLDTGSVGLYPAPEGFRSDYDCTPIGAEVFGGAGVDGIHFCRIRGFGDMVFAVSPMNDPDDCVHPLAENFADFLRLLLSCGDTAAPEQAHQWERSQFNCFLRENPPSAEGKALLDTIADILKLTPMPQPYEYIRKVQAEFDYSRLRFGKAHREALAAITPKEEAPGEWTVRFGGTLYGDISRGNARPGQEVRLDHVFHWGNEDWHIPAVYLCGGGVVMDLCARVDRAAMELFWSKWAPKLKDGSLTEEERDAIRSESPMNITIRPSLTVNGKSLHWNHGSSSVWAPTFAEADEDTRDNHARRVLEHYGLDLHENWSVHRMSFPWATRKPAVRSMALTMIAEDTKIPGIRFAAKAGDEIPFTHPTAGTEHLLTVLELQPVDIPHRMPEEDVEFPTHCVAMEYAVAPDLEQNAVFLQDCDSGDPPRPKGSSGKAGPVRDFGVIGAIVRSKDGPATVMVKSSDGVPVSAAKRSACSSLHFQPPETVEWQLSFRVKLREDHTETLM